MALVVAAQNAVLFLLAWLTEKASHGDLLQANIASVRALRTAEMATRNAEAVARSVEELQTRGGRAAGLAADVRYYGEWMRDRAWERIGHLYPPYVIASPRGAKQSPPANGDCFNGRTPSRNDGW